MGYYSTVHGELTYSEELDSIKVMREIQALDSVFGATVNEYGISWDWAQGKFYNLSADVEALIELVKDKTKVNGEIRVNGEEASDLWRILVKDNKITVEEAVVMWPDGTKADF